ncbi:MAG: Ig-like domain-containing protein [Planctomycetes bacterium]|nr:Ig-like domain-containing protein [Planctomycetota bacterium]
MHSPRLSRCVPFLVLLLALAIGAGCKHRRSGSDVTPAPTRPDSLTGPTIDPLPPFTQASVIQVKGRTLLAGSSLLVQGGMQDMQVGPFDDRSFVFDLPLRDNRKNRLVLTELFADGSTSPVQTVDIVHDTTPPSLQVDYPADQATVPTERVQVLGRVADTLTGQYGLQVEVNGRAADVYLGLGTNGTFRLPDVDLPAGVATEIVVRAVDAAGNATERRLTATHVPPIGTRILPSSGDLQRAGVHQQLPEPLVVRVLNPDDSPLVGKVVKFRVVRSDGRVTTVQGGLGDPETTVLTDAGGFASVFLTLGSDAGFANNRVEVTSKDVNSSVLFLASADAGLPNQVNVSSGSDQVVAAGGPAHEPLRVWVSDGCNGVAGVPVRFSVMRGAGTVSSTTEWNQEVVTTPTDATGHAEVTLQTGQFGGINEVLATFEGHAGPAAVFTVHGRLTDTGSTTFTGVVLDNSSQPIEHATCTLTYTDATEVTLFSDENGKFEFTALERSGTADLLVDGATATRVGGRTIQPQVLRFPCLHYEVVIIPGAANGLAAPVLLPRLDPANDVQFDNSQDVTLTCNGIEGLSMTIRANSMTLADGSHPAPGSPVRVAINQVHHDDVPMPIPDGAAPPFTWTLQPAGAHFDPPVSITYPNMTGLPPGSITNFLSFDHDTGRFEIVATGAVSADGASITTDPGVGLSVSGWGCNCPPYSVTGDCKNCFEVAVVLFKGGPGSFNSSVGAGLRTMAAALRAIDPEKVTTRIVASSGSIFGGTATPQLNDATQWLASLESDECPRPHVGLVGHSLGGDTIRFSDGITADFRVALDPISRDLALQFPTSCEFYQRGHTFAGPSGVRNYLAADFTGTELTNCQGTGCLSSSCLRGYHMTGGSETLTTGDHSTVVGEAQADVESLVRALLPTPFAGDNPTAFLDETFTLSVGGRSLPLDADGHFHIRNIPAADAFGAGGPGSAPDFLSDDYLRVTGVGVFQNAPCYVFSEPFQIRQGRTTVLSNLTFTAEPPPLPVSISLSLDRPVLTSQSTTANATVIATLANNSQRDVTRRTSWTTYRSSNPAVVTVDEDGLVTAVSDGVAVITATNEGTSSVARIEVQLSGELTTVVGFARRPDGSPVANATISIIGQGATGVSDANGHFSVADVLATNGRISLLATATIGGTLLRGTSGQLDPVANGLTDAGIIVIDQATSAGTDFLLAFPRNYGQTSTLRLFVSGDVATVGQVQIPGLAYLDEFTVVPGLVTTVDIPANAEVTSSDGSQPFGIFLTTVHPVCVYGLNQVQYTTDAYAAVPIAALGTSYRVASYTGGGGTASATQLAVTALINNTVVTITPKTTLGSHAAGQPYNVTLNAGDVYQLAVSSGDCTGTLVTSTQPVGVFGTHRCAFIPAGVNYCDHLVEMLPPTGVWGTSVYTVSLGGRQNGDTFRVLAHDDNTAVTITGTSPNAFSLNAGDFNNLILDGLNTITADHPIMVMQYANGGRYDSRVGDPFMMLLPWEEQFQSSYTVTTPPTGFATHYINIVAPTAVASAGGVALDGTAVTAGQFTAIPGSAWSGARIVITPGSHRVAASAPFGLYVYGWNNDDSYGYPGGMNLSTR